VLQHTYTVAVKIDFLDNNSIGGIIRFYNHLAWFPPGAFLQHASCRLDHSERFSGKSIVNSSIGSHFFANNFFGNNLVTNFVTQAPSSHCLLRTDKLQTRYIKDLSAGESVFCCLAKFS
jgi:hypothetical protein